MPPAPVGQPPPAPFSAGVVVPQAARMPEMLESETAAPPDRRRKSRRVVARRRSFGCMKLSLLNRLATQARVERSNELGRRVEDHPSRIGSRAGNSWGGALATCPGPHFHPQRAVAATASAAAGLRDQAHELVAGPIELGVRPPRAAAATICGLRG